MFETGCFIHSHPIAYIFNLSPTERQRRGTGRESGGKGPELLRVNDQGGDRKERDGGVG